MPRSIMADIIYKNEDDPGASTAAEPHIAPGFSPPPVVATTALPASGMSGLRQRRGRAEGGGAVEKAPQPEVMVLIEIHSLTTV